MVKHILLIAVLFGVATPAQATKLLFFDGTFAPDPYSDADATVVFSTSPTAYLAWLSPTAVSDQIFGTGDAEGLPNLTADLNQNLPATVSAYGDTRSVSLPDLSHFGFSEYEVITHYVYMECPPDQFQLQIYGWGNFDVDESALAGTSLPEPTVFTLLAVLVGGLCGLRRRNLS